MKTLAAFIKNMFKKHVHEYGPEYREHGMLLRQCKHCRMVDILRDYIAEASEQSLDESIEKYRATMIKIYGDRYLVESGSGFRNLVVRWEEKHKVDFGKLRTIG